MRWTLNTINGTLSESLLDDHALEFPRLNKNFNGKDYRFGYTCQFSEGTNFGSVFKHDVKKQTTEEYRFAGEKEAAEPIFVSRENAQSEDDGWLLTYLFDPAKETSEVVILDAQDFKSAPIASIKLATRVPHGFHGDWIAERRD
jgi:carotenoid cleavage dioxygenase